MSGVLLSGDAYPRCKQVSPDCSLWYYQFRRQLPTRSLHQSCWPEVWQHGQSHRPGVWATPAQAATAHRCLGPSHRAAQGRMSYQCRTREALWLVGIREDEDKFSETRSKTRGWGARGCMCVTGPGEAASGSRHFLHMCWHPPSVCWRRAWGSGLSTCPLN